MDSTATIGDSADPIYEFEWPERTRTSDEIGDFEEAGIDCTIDEIVAYGRADDECTVRIVGFE